MLSKLILTTTACLCLLSTARAFVLFGSDRCWDETTIPDHQYNMTIPPLGTDVPIPSGLPGWIEIEPVTDNCYGMGSGGSWWYWLSQGGKKEEIAWPVAVEVMMLDYDDKILPAWKNKDSPGIFSREETQWSFSPKYMGGRVLDHLVAECFPFPPSVKQMWMQVTDNNHQIISRQLPIFMFNQGPDGMSACHH